MASVEYIPSRQSYQDTLDLWTSGKVVNRRQLCTRELRRVNPEGKQYIEAEPKKNIGIDFLIIYMQLFWIIQGFWIEPTTVQFQKSYCFADCLPQ